LETIADARLLAITLGNFGVLELEMGRPESAVELHQRSLALLSGSGDRRSEALCHGRLGAALALLGKIEEAEAKLARGERLAPRDDELVHQVVRLDGAFVALARARRDMDAGNLTAADQGCAAVRRHIEHARQVDATGRSLSDHSDDIRSTLRILEAELAQTKP
jgi:tetratricopeptide (TPR) repeat protein